MCGCRGHRAYAFTARQPHNRSESKRRTGEQEKVKGNGVLVPVTLSLMPARPVPLFPIPPFPASGLRQFFLPLDRFLISTAAHVADLDRFIKLLRGFSGLVEK